MRFHHSTRRGRNRFSQGGNTTPQAGGKLGHPNHSLSSRWAQLNYCRQTNIHFNSRLPVDLPDEMRHKSILHAEQNSHSPLNQLAKDDLLAMTPVERSFPAGPPTSNKYHHRHHHHHHHQHHHGQLNDTHLNQFDKLSLTNEWPQSTDETGKSSSRLPTRSSSVRRSLIEHKRHQAVDSHQHKNQHKNQEQHSGEAENGQSTTSKTSESRANLTSTGTGTSTSTTTGHGKMTGLISEKHTDRLRPKFDLEAAREKLVAQVDKHPFWSTKAAKRMRLLGLFERKIYIYELTSYCERRDLEWRYEPYRGTKSSPGLFGGIQARRLYGRNQQTSLSSQPQSPLATPGGECTIDGESVDKPNPPPPTPAGGLDQSAGAVRSAFAFEQAGLLDRMAPGGSPLRQNNSHQLQRQTSSSGTVASAGGNRLIRSCSSATSSPVRTAEAGAPAGAISLERPPLSSSHANLGDQNSTGQQQVTQAGVSCEVARPMPSPKLVWSIVPPEAGAVVQPAPFTCYLHTSEVPGTSFVKRCHGCQGRGRLKCATCYGVGYEVCLSCTGRGSLRSYSALSAGGGLGRASAGGRTSGLDSSGSDQNPRNRSSGGGITGGMWANASSSSSSGRFGGGGGLDSTSGADETIGGGLSSQVCANCSGAGQKRCWICAGRSFITCTACAGTGSLRCFLNLNITYLNHRDEVCLNNADGLIPRDRLKLSSGLLLADETADQLSPLTGSTHLVSRAPPSPLDGALCDIQPHASSVAGHHQDGQVSPSDGPLLEHLARPGELSQLAALSAKLLDKHWHDYKHERLIKQRHRVTQIECFKVDWEFRKKRGHFVVYGDERKVYIAKYPFKSICNIT